MAAPMIIGLRAIVRNRPLRWGLIVGALTALGLAFMPGPLTALTRGLIAWDAGLSIYLIVLLNKMMGATPEHIAERAAETDQGRHFTLFVSLTGVVISVAVIVAEAGAAAIGPKAVHVAFVFLTVTLSWLFIHTTFAAHYAHEYYGPGEGRNVREGLLFPGGEKPDFWDFWHFALVIGVANQTADVQITSKTIRRIVTLHGIMAFVFNTVILALTINLAAGLFQ